MKFRDKRIKLLKLLYVQRFDGKYHEILELLQLPKENYTEASIIGQSLVDDDLIKLAGSKTSISAMIKSKGIEFIEEDSDNLQSSNSRNLFSEIEKEKIKERLNEFNLRLSRLELGQQIIYDDLTDRIEELKELLEVLNKQNWSSIFKGVLIEHGLGKIYGEVTDLLVKTFKDNTLIQ